MKIAKLLHIVVVLSMCALVAGGASAEQVVDASTRYEGLYAIDEGLEWLRGAQLEDGSWSQYPAITAMIVTGFLRREGGAEENKEAIERGLEFILKHVRSDGGIYPEGDLPYPTMNTALCMTALAATKDPKYHEQVLRAREFVLSMQAAEHRGYMPDSCFYGGIGYGSDEDPDLDALQWSLEALRATDYLVQPPEQTGDTQVVRHSEDSGKHTGLFWDKALVFLQRCQNLDTYNDQEWAQKDGGFIYSPVESKAGGYTSYGSMTYAGIKSLVYAKLTKEDPRVQAATSWCAQNYTMEENPEMGLQGLYYYYHAMSKALDALGENVVVDANGDMHEWRKDLTAALASRQHTDGYWVNSNARWWENNKDLATAHAILALETAIGM